MSTYRGYALIADHDYRVEIDYTITSPAIPPNLSGPPEHCDPGENAEYDIDDIRLYEDHVSETQLEVPTWLRNRLEEYCADDILTDIGND